MVRLFKRQAKQTLILLISIKLILGLLSPALTVAGLNAWTGHGPEGGTINSLVMSPNFSVDHTVFAGTARGGIFKSVNDGLSWTQISSDFADTTIGSLAISPDFTADGTLFAGTATKGLWKSTDSGATWIRTDSSFSNICINSVVVSPNYALDRTIFAGTEGGGAYRSTDGGLSWVLLNTPVYVRSLAVSPNYDADSIVFAGTYLGVYKSIDGGANWAQKNSGLIQTNISSLTLSPSYAVDGTIFAGTRNGGNSAVYKTTDSAENWSSSAADGQIIELVAISPNYQTDGTVFFGTYQGIYKTTDRGSNWASLNNGISDSRTRSFAISPNYDSDQTLFLGVYGAGVYRTTDRGTTWNPANSGLFATTISELAVSPNFAFDKVAYAGTGANGVYKTTNAGQNWYQGGLANQSVRALSLSPSYTQDGQIFAGTSSGVYRSIDEGANWSVIGLAGVFIADLAISPDYSSDKTVFAGAVGGLYKSTNSGLSWIRIDSGFANDYVRAVVLSPNYSTDQTIFAGTDSGGIYRSTDGGLSWTSAGNGITNYIVSLALSPQYATDHTVFAGTAIGVYKSSDSAGTWVQVDSGFENTNIYAIALSPNYAADNTVFAGTDGAGIYRSTNQGGDWTQNNTALTNRNVRTIAFSSDYSSDNTVLIGTNGNGVLDYTFSDVAPPITTLETAPSSQDGTNGWFKTTPAITLTRDEPGATYYQWDSTSTGSWVTYGTSFSGLDGQHTLYYYSEDTANNTETIKSQAFKVDTQVPAAFTQNMPANGATVNRPYPYFSWNDTTDTNSGLARYQLFIDGVANSTDIVGWNASVPSSALANGSHTWFVRAWDGAGNQRDSTTRSLTVETGAGRMVFERATDIYIMNPDGTGQTRLTNTPSNIDPVLSLDGTKISFSSTRDDGNTGEIYIMNSDGTGQTRLTNSPAWDRMPAFSPDGTKIAFTSDPNNDGESEIYTMNIDGTGQVRITNNPGQDEDPVFSPDGSQIAFDSESEIYLMRPDGSNRVKVPNTGGVVSLSFTPDGQRMAFGSSRDGNTDVYLVDTDGANLQRLTFGTQTAWYPSVSPDGQQVAFGSFRDWQWGVHLMHIDGTFETSRIAEADAGRVNWGPGASLPSDITAPTTNLSTVLASPDGTNGWFKTTPTVTLTSNEAGSTKYRWESDSTDTVYSAPFAAPEGTHTLSYSSQDTVGNQEATKTQEFKVDAGNPTAPTLSGVAASGMQIDLSWTDSTDTVSWVSGYNIYRSSDNSFVTTTILTSRSITGLSPGTTYGYYVRAVDVAGNLSAPSNTVSIDTPQVPDNEVPSTPTIVGFTPSNSEIGLYWRRSTDNVGVAGYKVFNADTDAQITTTTAGYYLFDNLSAATLYNYYVKAFDGAGNLSGASNVAKIDPGRDTATPVGANVTVNPSPQVDLVFTGITGAGASSVTQEATNTGGPPSGFRFRGNQYEIQTTALFTAPIQVSIKYDPDSIQGSEANIKLFHFEGGSWNNVTSYVDAENNIIVGQVNSLSPFGIGEPEGGPIPVPASSPWALAGLALVGLMFLVRRIKKGQAL